MADIQAAITQSTKALEALREKASEIDGMARELCGILRRGGMLLVCGNGGSASQAQHFAAELVVRFRRDRRGLRAVALTTDGAVVSAVANDYGAMTVYARQVHALARPGDAVLGISTSGNSQNVQRALQAAGELGLYTFALLGNDGGAILRESPPMTAIVVQAADTARIQEAHLLILHCLADAIEERYVEEGIANG